MYHDYNGNEIEDLEMDNMRRDSREEQHQGMEVLFDEARAYLYISDGLGRNIDLKPKQALELMDFLLRQAETIRGYTLVEGMAEAEKDMQKLETAMWEKYQQEEGKPDELCEGCHRSEEMCICGGVPDEF